MEVRKESRIKNIISFILSIILMFSIVLVIFSSFIKFICLNPRVYLNILHNKGTENQIYETIQNNLKYALVINNIPDNILDNVITEEEVQIQVDDKIESIIKYLKTDKKEILEINTELYLNRFNDNLYKYFNENSVEINDSLKMDIDNLKDSVNQIIVNEIEIINSNTIINSSKFNDVAKVTSEFNNNLYFLMILPMLFIIFILLCIWHGNMLKALMWIGNGILAAGIILSLLFISGYISGFYENIIIYIPYLKEFVSEVIKQYLKWLCISGVITLGIGIFICTITNIKKNNIKV